MTPSWPIKKVITCVLIEKNGDVTEFVAPCKRSSHQDFSMEGHGPMGHNHTEEANFCAQSLSCYTII